VLLRCALKLTAVVDDLNANHYAPSPSSRLVRNELVYLEPATGRWTPAQLSHLAAGACSGQAQGADQESAPPGRPA
jgi:hypothetical protein